MNISIPRILCILALIAGMVCLCLPAVPTYLGKSTVLIQAPMLTYALLSLVLAIVALVVAICQREVKD
jgi:uncharacterized protein YqgC (DUF456 family)